MVRDASDEELGEIAAELFDVEQFFALCRSQPEIALTKLSRFVEGAPSMNDNYPFLLFRFVALGVRARGIFESGGDSSASVVQSVCEESLRQSASILR